MKKVTVFVGSAHRQNTYKAAVQFVENLQALDEVEGEIVTLSDYSLKACRGCRACFDKGPQFCPLKDDRDLLMEKIAASDGIVFATPNYCYHMSGIMKTFIDRFGYIIHRPCYFGKTFTGIVSQANVGGSEIVKYLDMLAFGLGFNTVKGSVLTAFDPCTEQDQHKIDRALADLSRRFYAALAGPGNPAPTWFKLMYFRIGRTMIRGMLDDSNIDYSNYAERGWFQSEYYYPIRLNLLKKLGGRLFDWMMPALRKLYV